MSGKLSLRFEIFMGLFLICLLAAASPAAAQNVFPLTVSGQQNLYVDTNDNRIREPGTDGYFTLTLVQLVNAGADAGNWAVLLEGHDGIMPSGGFGQLFVLDGDVNGDGSFHIHEVAVDSTYLGDDGSEVAVKVPWAHIGLADAIAQNYIGFLYSAVLEMSDPNNPFSGFNKATFVEEGTGNDLSGANGNETVVTIEYNNDDYAKDISFSEVAFGFDMVFTNLENAVAGTALLTDGGASPVWLLQQCVMLLNDLSNNYIGMFIPLTEDGSIVLSDGTADGFMLKTSLKLVHDVSPTPARMPAGWTATTTESKQASYSKDRGFCMIETMKTPQKSGVLWMGLMLMLGLGAAVALRKK